MGWSGGSGAQPQPQPGSMALPGLCHTWQAGAGRRRLQRATWLRAPLGGQRRRGAVLEQAQSALGQTCRVGFCRGSPTRTPSMPSSVLIPGTAIAQGLWHGASLPRRGRKRPEQWGRHLCSSWDRMENPSHKPWNNQHAPNPGSGQGCLDEVQSCLHQHSPSLKPTPLAPTGGWGEGSAHHS